MHSAPFLDPLASSMLIAAISIDPDQVEFVPGIFQLARFWATELRRPIVVVTNQSGIGRGYFDENAYAELTQWICGRFEAENAPIARVYHCAYRPVHGLDESSMAQAQSGNDFAGDRGPWA